MKIDYFLYSCFEFEQTCKAFPSKALGPQRWPATVQFAEEQRTDFEDLGGLEAQLEASLRWYASEFPALTTDHTIALDNIGEIASAAVYFCLDLRLLAGKDSNALEALASDHNELWAAIDRIIDHVAPSFAPQLKAYLRWAYVKVEEKYWEAGSRPPVGRYTPGARRGRPFGASSSGPRRSGPGGGRPSNGSDRDRGPRREGGGDRGPRPGGRDRNDRDRGPRRPLSDSSAGRGSHADQEQAALESVVQALERLRTETTLTEIILDPSNSFFRRLQHKKAVSEGFFSYSTGEGSGRAVVVTREKPEHEDGI